MAPKWGHVYGARQKFSNSTKTKGEEKQLVLERVDVTKFPDLFKSAVKIGVLI